MSSLASLRTGIAGTLASVRGTQLFVPLERHPRLRADERLRFDRGVGWVRMHGRLRLASPSRRRMRPCPRHVPSGGAVSRRRTSTRRRPWSPIRQGAQARSELMLVQGALIGPCRDGPARRLPEHLGHDAGAQRHPGAGALHTSGDRRESRTAGPVSSCRSHHAGEPGGCAAPRSCSSARPRRSHGGSACPFRPFAGSAEPQPASLCDCASDSAWRPVWLFGLLPAIRFSRPALVSALKDDAGGGGRRVGRIHRLTAALQIGIAIPFLVVSGAMVDWVRTTAQDLGFEPEGLAAVRLDLNMHVARGGQAAGSCSDASARARTGERRSICDDR